MKNKIVKKAIIIGFIFVFLGTIAAPAITVQGAIINKISPQKNNEKVEPIQVFDEDVEFYGVFFGIAKWLPSSMS